MSAMSVILRQARTGSFYYGRNSWSSDPTSALDLKTVEQAVETGREEDAGEVQIIAQFEHPDIVLVFPLRLSRISPLVDWPADAAVVALATGRVASHYPGAATAGMPLPQ